MVIVDSTVWVDYLNGRHNPETDWLDDWLAEERLGLTTLILCEVLQGIRDERKAALVEDELRGLEIFEAGGVELALRAAGNAFQATRPARIHKTKHGCAPDVPAFRFISR